MLIGVAIFIVGSVACALAPTMWALIAARALQGIGGGGILPIAQTIIADLVSPRERPRYQSYSAVMFMVASVIGPVLGGVLTDHMHWSLIFWINVPMGAVALVMTYRALRQAAAPRAPAPARHRRRRADGGGGDRADAGDDLGRHALSAGCRGRSSACSRARRVMWALFALRLAERGRAVHSARGAARAGGDAHRRRRLLQHRRHHRAVDLRAALSRAGARRLAVGVGHSRSSPSPPARSIGAFAAGRSLGRGRHYKRVPMVGLPIAIASLAVLAAAPTALTLGGARLPARAARRRASGRCIR